MQFSLRDMLWLMTVLSLITGFYLREMHLQDALARESRWRMAAGALEDVMKEDGWAVTWGYRDNQVLLIKSPGRFENAKSVHTSRSVLEFTPSAEVP